MRYTAIDIESGETVTFCTYEGQSLHQALGGGAAYHVGAGACRPGLVPSACH